MIDADDLPDGWAVATIEDLCTLNPKHPATVGDATEVSFVPMAAVSDLDGRIVGTETRKYGEVKKGYTHFADGDVIFAKITPCMENGKAASVRGLVNGLACGTTEFFVFRSRGAVDQDYLFHFIRQESFRKAARATMQSGVGQARVPKEFVLSTELPLPPLAEQRRIVAKVEELMARSRAARAALAEVPTLLEQFRQSMLASAFRGDLTADWRAKNPTAEPASVLLDRIRADRRKLWETKYPKKKYAEPEPVDDSDLPELPEGWCWATVEELVSATDYGTSAKTNEDNTGIPVLRMGNIVEGRLSLASLKYLPADHDEFPKLMLRAGDVLFNRTNSPELVGKAAVYSGQPERCSFASYLIRLRLDALNPYLLAAYINSPYGRAWIRSVVQQQVGQANVNGTKLMALAVPVPPVLEQRVIADRIELSQSGLSAAANVLAETLADLDTLDQAILAKAFRGELVPQDPADEPAAALLARIRSGVSATRSVERGRVKFYILLLLRTWKKPLSREMLERGLVLMLNADVRRAILGRSKPAPKRGKKSGTTPRFVAGLDLFLGEMLDDGDLVPGPEAGFFAEGQHGIDFAAAPKADLDAVRETAEAMKVIHKDKLQATDADIVSALHGEIYELVS